MSNELAVVPGSFNDQQLELIKKTVAKGCSTDELNLFLYTCKRTGLDPLIRQIYAVKRGGASAQMSIQTGIDGYRLIAERTGKYAPGREPSYNEKDGKIISSTAYVKKLVNGEWHEVAATAYFDEYAQSFNGVLGTMWKKMGHVMIAKCAEALALRRAFPAEMGGVYTAEEMEQAGPVEATVVVTPQRKSVSAPHEPTPEEIEAKVQQAKERLHANDAKMVEKPAVEAPKAPADGVKLAKGVMTYRAKANGGGYIAYCVENYQTEEGKDMRFSTNDATIIETLNAKYDKELPVGIEYVTVVNGAYTNYNIVGLVSVE